MNIKKIIRILLIIILLAISKVGAASFKTKELIPAKSTVTVIGDRFKYIGMHLSDDKIIFQSVENISEKEYPISVSIAFFDKNEKNIGTIYACSQGEMLLAGEKKEYSVSIGSLEEAEDIRYFAVFNDNVNCYNEISQDYLGQKIEEMAKTKEKMLTDDVEILVKVMLGVGALLIGIFLYKYLFTSSYANMNGEDIRKDYQNRQEQKKEELLNNPPIKEEPILQKGKSDEVIQQEKRAALEDKTSTDLHNLYKKKK